MLQNCKSGRLCNTPLPIHLCVLAPISKASSGNHLGSNVETYINWVYSRSNKKYWLTKIYRPKHFSHPRIFPWLLTADHVGQTYTVLSQAVWNLEAPESYPKMSGILTNSTHSVTQEAQRGSWRSPGCLQEPLAIFEATRENNQKLCNVL